MPKKCRSCCASELRRTKLQIYNYVLVNKATTTVEVEELLGVKARRARKILSDMCNTGILMKIEVTINLKNVLRN